MASCSCIRGLPGLQPRGATARRVPVPVPAPTSATSFRTRADPALTRADLGTLDSTPNLPGGGGQVRTSFWKLLSCCQADETVRAGEHAFMPERCAPPGGRRRKRSSVGGGECGFCDIILLRPAMDVTAVAGLVCRVEARKKSRRGGKWRRGKKMVPRKKMEAKTKNGGEEKNWRRRQNMEAKKKMEAKKNGGNTK